MSSTPETLGDCLNATREHDNPHPLDDDSCREWHPVHRSLPDARTEVDEAKCVWSGQSPAPAVWAGRKGDRVTCECGASVALCARRLNWSRAQDTYLKDHAAAPYTPGTPEPEGRLVCGGCGLPMSRNPHPDAGSPTLDGSQVGYVWECIPCLVQTRNRVGRSWPPKRRSCGCVRRCAGGGVWLSTRTPANGSVDPTRKTTPTTSPPPTPRSVPARSPGGTSMSDKVTGTCVGGAHFTPAGSTGPGEGLSHEELAKLRAIADAAAPGPWHWSGNIDFEDPSLCRWGNYGLEEVVSSVTVDRTPDDPRIQNLEDVFDDQADIDQARQEFLEDENGDPRTDRHLSFTVGGIKTSARAMPVFEVCPSATDRTDPRVYRANVTGIRHPDAVFIAAADPSTVLQLLGAVAALRERVEELEQRDQRWVDEVCAYRNLAIFLGAKPTDMLNEYDRNLCESGIDTGFAPDDSTTADARAEVTGLWAENDALRDRAERAEGERDELVWLMEHRGLSIHRGDFVRSDGTRTTMVVKVSEPARLAKLLAAALENES